MNRGRVNFAKARPKLPQPKGSLPWAVNQYTYGNEENAMRIANEGPQATITPNIIFNPDAEHKPGFYAERGSVHGLEYKKYLDSLNRQRSFIAEQEKYYKSQKDVVWDFNKGLFGAPADHQPAAQGRPFRLMTGFNPAASKFGGQVGYAVDHVDTGPGLQVFDEQTRTWRYTDGTSQYDWVPQGNKAVLNNAVQGATAQALWRPSHFNGRRPAGCRSNRANALTFEDPYFGRTVTDNVGGQKLRDATKMAFQTWNAASGGRPSRIQFARATDVLRSTDGFDARMFEPQIPQEEPVRVGNLYPVFQIREAAVAASPDGRVETVTVNGRAMYVPSQAMEQAVAAEEQQQTAEVGQAAVGSSSSSLDTNTLILILVVGVIAAVAIGYALFQKTEDPFAPGKTVAIAGGNFGL